MSLSHGSIAIESPNWIHWIVRPRIADLFRTMVSYMETKGFVTVQNWRNNLLHTDASNPGPGRNQFWYDVVKKSLSILKASDLQTKWWNEYANRTNAHIKAILMRIIEPSVTIFLNHNTTKACLSEMRKTGLKFLLIIDEAAYLYQTNYMHSFMWVLDEQVVSVLKILGQHSPQAHKFLYSCLPLILRFLMLRQTIYIHPNESSAESSRFHLYS